MNLNEDTTLHGLEDEYMDDLIRLAVKRERMRETEEILKLSREPVTPEEESRLDRIWSQALAGMDEINNRKKKESRNRTMRSVLVNFSRVAACLAVLIMIGAGFAVATNSTFRSAVYRLFITEDAENNVINMSFMKDMDAGFDVPEEWLGVYFPTAIPEGFVFTEAFEDPDIPYIEYADENGKSFTFTESDKGDGTFTNNGTVREMTINGYSVHVIEKQNPTTIEANWATDDRWLTLSTHNMTWDETQSLIESFRRIIREDQ
ncbi:MAG: DUF4367 domain-containing protein, partial [Clostridia bacterium]|nr:DUF4367 domain-containing protein [Clostridia bacterium]MBQ6562275.1 DUF4367 domain-containing protein [Clostridia bacterium]